MTKPITAPLSGGLNTELLDLAQRLRLAISGENGVIELNSCLDVALSLDRLGLLLSQTPALEGSAPQVPEAWALTASNVMRALDLTKLGHAGIIAELASRRGTIVSRDELAEKCGYTTNSLPVMIFHVRKELENREFPIMIKALHRRGYCLEIDDAAWVEERVQAYLNRNAATDPGTDEAVALFRKLDAPACLEGLFVTLASRVGHVVSYEELRESHGLSASTLKVYASRLRHLLKEAGHPKLIENVSSLGYRVQADAYRTMKAHLLPH